MVYNVNKDYGHNAYAAENTNIFERTVILYVRNNKD